MTIPSARSDTPEELEGADALRNDAEAAYIAALACLVDIRSLTGGRDGYDFYVRVPASQMHETTQRIVDLEYAIRDQYGVHFQTYAIATPG